MSALFAEQKTADELLLESREEALGEIARLLAYHSALATRLRYRWQQIHRGNVALRRRIGRVPEIAPALNITYFERVGEDEHSPR